MPAATERIISKAGTAPFLSGGEHLLAELERVSLMVHAEILRLRAVNQLTDSQFRGLYVSDEQVDGILHPQSQETANGDGGPAVSASGIVARRIAECEQQLEARCAASIAEGVVLPLERLAKLYGLSHRERDVLLLALAPELDSSFETLYSYAQNDVTRKRPTVGLILRLLEPVTSERLGLRTLFSPGGHLMHTPLLCFCEEAPEREAPLLSRAVRPEERVVDFLLEHDELDSRLRVFTKYLVPTRSLASLHFLPAFSDELKQAASILRDEGGALFFQGPSGTGKRAAAEALTAEAGRGLIIADLRHAGAAGAATSATLGLLRREARLRGANLLLTHAETCLPEDGAQRPPSRPFRDSLQDSVAGSGLVVFVASECPWPVVESVVPCAWTVFEFPVPEFLHRAQLWQEAAAAAGAQIEATLAAELANQFVLAGGQIHQACRIARSHARLRGREAVDLTRADFEAAARAQSSQSLRRRAQKIDPAHDWSDLVLPRRTLQQLREVCAAGKYHSFIYTEWGFDRRLMQGKGLSVLFCGPSGTGKTMSAGIVSRELGLDLYKIDLSSVISKYIGETEKQLSEIFREAQSSNAILFFDEADAIFGKRSEVKDAHDRYANVEVAYLLQKMEEYEGIVVLATNFRKNIDDAFTRRIHYIVEFPFPEEKYRERIWRTLIPAGAPLANDVDFGFLARQFELAGGNIRNVVLVAAFLAAEEGGTIRMEHFVLATARELQKIGKLPSRSDFREYYDLTRERT